MPVGKRALPADAVPSQVVRQEPAVARGATVAADARVEHPGRRADGHSAERVQLRHLHPFDETKRRPSVEDVDLAVREHVFEAMQARAAGRARPSNENAHLPGRG